MLMEELGLSGDEYSGEESQNIRTSLSGDNISIEVLNNGASPIDFNLVVELLNDSGYNVARVGNVEEKSTLSRVKSHVACEEALEELQRISKLVGITKMENDYYTSSEVDFTIVLGPKYVYTASN